MFARVVASLILLWLVSSSSAVAQTYVSGTGSLGGCSAAVIRFDGFTDDHLAWVVTNGHCIDNAMNAYPYDGGAAYLMAPGQVYVDVPQAETIYLANGNAQRELRALRIVYATLTDMDVAIVELAATYAELLQDGIESHRVSPTPPVVGEAVQVLSGYWFEYPQCAIEAIVPEIREDVFRWFNVVRLSRDCRLTDGFSGSIIKRQSDNAVVGLFNTWNEGGQACAIENPCEIGAADTMVRRGASYGPQLHDFYGCLNGQTLDLAMTGCALPKPNAT